MGDFKYITEEQLAAYLEGKSKISDMDMLNYMVQDVDMVNTMDQLDTINLLDHVDEPDSIELSIV